MAGKFSASEREHIRGKLRAQAALLLQTQRMCNISIDDLVRGAFISKGAFYTFYDFKEQLFAEVFLTLERELHQQLLTEINAPQPSAHARLVHLLKASMSVTARSPLLRLMTSEDVELMLRKQPPEGLADLQTIDIQLSQLVLARLAMHHIELSISAAELSGLLRAMFFVHLNEGAIGAEAAAVKHIMIEALAAHLLKH